MRTFVYNDYLCVRTYLRKYPYCCSFARTLLFLTRLSRIAWEDKNALKQNIIDFNKIKKQIATIVERMQSRCSDKVQQPYLDATEETQLK